MPCVERIKLRMKIGVHEFEAEGPRDVLTAQLDTWLRAAGLRTLPAADDAARPAATDPASDSRLRVFRVDGEHQLVVLRVDVNGRRRNADTALLLLHGFDTCLGGGDGAETAAVRLRTALAASGCRPRRMDRSLAPYVVAGLIRKGGSHKHETYALTAAGTRRAVLLARRFGATTVTDQASAALSRATMANDPNSSTSG